MTEKICYTIERHVSGISLAGTIKYAPVAQLDRALDSDSKGRWFESSRAYQRNPCSRNDYRVTFFAQVHTKVHTFHFALMISENASSVKAAAFAKSPAI